MATDQDKWAKWLLEGRDGGDPEQRAKSLEHLIPIRDRVLENASIHPGDVVLDVGGGDGLVAFGALDQVGDTGEVILADISDDLVARASRLADDLGVSDRMSFGISRAEDLERIADASVDVVTTRSVLIYVEDKEAAFRAFNRVLRPGGRFSIFEPINNYFPVGPEGVLGVRHHTGRRPRQEGLGLPAMGTGIRRRRSHDELQRSGPRAIGGGGGVHRHPMRICGSMLNPAAGCWIGIGS